MEGLGGSGFENVLTKILLDKFFQFIVVALSIERTQLE